MVVINYMKKIFYFYNEHLPKKTAHDTYIVNNCYGLSKYFNLSLYVGHRSLNNQNLQHHYDIKLTPSFSLKKNLLLRKSGPLKWSWNLPFFLSCQKVIRKLQPEIVILSVLKQASFHIQRKNPSTKYVYEIHQLNWYPGLPLNTPDINKEKNILQQFDLITVTTQELKDILRNPPYQLSNPIEIIPLATKSQSLKKAICKIPLRIFYVGQLYKEQGIDFLLKAWKKLPQSLPLELHIVGGSSKEITSLDKKIPNVYFHGFTSPGKLPNLLEQAHCFIAPFYCEGRMPFVAHTKIYEYLTWKRPIILPDIQHTRSLLKETKGILFYTPNDVSSLNQ